MLPEPVGDIVFSLGWGEYSEPFMSDGSLFIIRVDNRRDLGPYEQNRPDIYEWMKEQGIYYPEARRRKANEYAERLGWDVRGDSAAILLDSKLEEIEPEFGHISREYYDGLLLFEISNREVWEKASADIEGREAYFKSHVKQYKFDEPCFKGMVFFCIDEDVFHQVEDAVRGKEIYDWTDTILTFNRGDIKIRVMRGSTETGIIKKGQNAYVDKIVFGEGEYEPMKGFPYINVIGKVLDKPENSRDVATQVSEDYQNYIEQQWVKKLRKQYKHKIYKKVLKKVSLE
jgi:peptidyl-prolyl cis-trans isomerase SurA